MMHPLSETLIGREFFILKPNDELYIPVDNIINSLITTIAVETGCDLFFETCIEPPEFYNLPTTQHNDMIWETIQINGTTTPSITTSQTSIVFTAPSIIHLKNKGTGECRVNFRGVR